MSFVTNVLLCSDSCAESTGELPEGEESPAMKYIQRWLTRNGHPPLMNVDASWQGSNSFERNVWAGAFNHFLVDEFTQRVSDAPWVESHRDSVQLFICGQDDGIFTERMKMHRDRMCEL